MRNVVIALAGMEMKFHQYRSKLRVSKFVGILPLKRAMFVVIQFKNCIHELILLICREMLKVLHISTMAIIKSFTISMKKGTEFNQKTFEPSFKVCFYTVIIIAYEDWLATGTILSYLNCLYLKKCSDRYGFDCYVRQIVLYISF